MREAALRADRNEHARNALQKAGQDVAERNCFGQLPRNEGELRRSHPALEGEPIGNVVHDGHVAPAALRGRSPRQPPPTLDFAGPLGGRNGAFGAQRNDARDPEFRRLLNDEVHLLTLRKSLRENDLEAGRGAHGSRAEPRLDGRTVDFERCVKRAPGRIADFDRVAVSLPQNDDDLPRVRSLEGDQLAFAMNAIDEETRDRAQGENASFTRSRNERSSNWSPPSRANSSSSSRSRRESLVGTTT